MLQRLFSTTVYVRIYENRIVVKGLDLNPQPVTVRPVNPFTTRRLLVGELGIAEAALKEALRQVCAGRLFVPQPVMVMHPMERTEGGLSEIEERTFVELAMGAGARKAIVWVGGELSDTEVRQRAGTA